MSRSPSRLDPITAVFERSAAEYDAWYDTDHGAAILTAEIDAMRPLVADVAAPILEVGTGGGRFASALGAAFGVDPAVAPLRLAAARGVSVVAARGESLPFQDATFGGVLFVVALCFVADPAAALAEARRILWPDGRLVVGTVPSDSPWGRRYRDLAADGHPFYRHARFVSRAEQMAMLREAGFEPVRMRSTLFWGPAEAPASRSSREGDDTTAGFLAILAERRA